ncbi:hypothetical protein ACHAXA_000009 [Cyclostephanos tholiformis]|uniref:Chitin-binding type-4 domain-containing protein n=1 Tax=Cyclostephanos tholiformis TaxID=382380 RepID=A0ABD3REN9_9STRA
MKGYTTTRASSPAADSQTETIAPLLPRTIPSPQYDAIPQRTRRRRRTPSPAHDARTSGFNCRASSVITGAAVAISSVPWSSSPPLAAWTGRGGVYYRSPLFVSAHGYLKSPRSRNLVAFEDKNWETFLGGSGGSNDPLPEDCPHCLNKGGSLAQCGILYGNHDENGKLVPWERNYDKPLNVRKLPMSPNVQGEYMEGDVIEVEAMVTTHHKGHFEFSVCPIKNSVPMEVPTEKCFVKNKLEFVSDELYGAPFDPNYPERAYIAPASKANWGQGSNLYAANYKFKVRLPMGVYGDLVLLQWYYLTANSCKHEGYADYPFPEAWGSDTKLYPGLPDCGELPKDGNGVPEQFWNCAEVKIRRSDDKVPATSNSHLDALHGSTGNGGSPSQDGNTSDSSESTGSDQSIGTSSPPKEDQSSTSDMVQTTSEIQGGFSPDVFTDLSNALEKVKEEIDSKLFLYQTPDLKWEPSSVYRYKDFSESLNVMATEGVAGKTFYIGESAAVNGYVYGLVNIAAFLAQSMKETIQYDACDENSWEMVGGIYPLSNACGQLGQSYQDYHCSPEEAHMECKVDPNMSLVGVTHAKVIN